jgi:flagellar basal body-associated protein FliL
MKKSTIIIIVSVIVLVLIAGFIAVKMMSSPKGNPANIGSNSTSTTNTQDIAVESMDVATIDSTTQEIDTSTFSDTALNDLG